ncbi:MAG: hypothetical protein AAGG56_11630 [Pseudomonadota bacterium]
MHHVGLRIKDKLVLVFVGALVSRSNLLRFSGTDTKEPVAKNFVHCNETRSHPCGRVQEFPPTDAKPFAVLIRKFFDALFNLFLLG